MSDDSVSSGDQEIEPPPEDGQCDPYSCLHKNIERRENKVGFGLYAKGPILKGEVVYDPKLSSCKTLITVDAKTMSTWDQEQYDFFEKYTWQVRKDLWVGPGSPEDLKRDYANFINHSCDPSVWFEGEEVLVARRDLEVDDEITFDYGTCETEVKTFLMTGCLCGRPNCRGSITPWDYRLPSLRQNYESHFMPFIYEMTLKDPISLGTGMYKHLHKDIEVRPSPIGGNGIFAVAVIPKGSIVWCGEGSTDERVDWETMQSFPEEKKKYFLHYCSQASDNVFSSIRLLDDLKDDASHYMNHSCDPNVWFIGDTLMEARRDIQPGEEITYDYGTSDSIIERVQMCTCGSLRCRGHVTPKDYLLPELQATYKHHFALYLLEKIGDEWGSIGDDDVSEDG